MTLKKRILRTLVLVSLGLLIGGGVGLYQISMEDARVLKKGESHSTDTGIAGLKIGGPFTLTDHTGKKVTEADYAGHYQLIYFGFTYCPAICPTELQKMTKVLNMLPQDASDKIIPLFFTIDPQRDTPDVMADYVSLFHPRLIGLTGTQPQIDNVTRAYRIFANKVNDPELSDYTMDHSTFIYLMGKDNELLSIYRIQDDADYIKSDILGHMLSAPQA